MQCDNRFCVYWSLKECTLDEVELDIQGNCLDCIYVDIDENLLIKKRYEMLKRFEENMALWQDDIKEPIVRCEQKAKFEKNWEILHRLKLKELEYLLKLTKNFANLFNIDEYRQRPREQQADMLINILDEILDNERGTYGFYQLYLDELLDDGEQSDMRKLMEDQYQLVKRLLLHCTNVVLNQILD